MNKDLTLAVMAAGMGSRFGGLKQIEPVGPNGETILDYSVYDAMRAGFSKIVFIIKHEIEEDFRRAVGERIEKKIDVDYAFQSIDDVPFKRADAAGREKPWGTGQAILSARNVIKTPFAVINADDFYGADAFFKLGQYLSYCGDYCMAGYKLCETLTENGTVSRGVCTVEDGYLKDVTEHTAIDKNSALPMDSIVSMNMWGLKTEIFDILEERFTEFLKTLENPLKGEFYIPTVMNDLAANGTKIKVLSTNAKWLGMTYREDLPIIKSELLKLSNQYKQL